MSRRNSAKNIAGFLSEKERRKFKHCNNGLQCIAAGEHRSCICLCDTCTLAGRAALKDGAE